MKATEYQGASRPISNKNDREGLEKGEVFAKFSEESQKNLPRRFLIKVTIGDSPILKNLFLQLP